MTTDGGGAAMSANLNETIADLARTTIFSSREILDVAAEYPDADFLRFVAHSWGSGIRLATWQLAEMYYNPMSKDGGRQPGVSE